MLTAGEILKTKRNSLGKTLERVSEDTKIQIRFLRYIENNEFSEFDSDVFLTGFIKIYSQYLGLDPSKVLALYRRSKPSQRINTNKIKKKKSLKIKRSFLTPKFLISTSIVLFLLLILGYIGFQIYNFQSPPKLEILQPTNNQTVDTQYLTIKGKTEIKSSLDINNSPVKVNADGTFEAEITLNEGVNLITLKTRKNNNNILETVEVLKIIYTKPEQAIEPDKIVENKLKLVVSNSLAWIKLDIDGENKISQNVQPSTQEFLVKDNFKITTGRLANTQIFFNEAQISWKTNTSTGVAEISCKIVNQLLECQ